MGGLRINTKAQVMHVRTQQPIGRLYAAGEITGGIHGASRLGSNAITDCLVFGRIAGRNAAQEPSRR
jgi:succinate dehydrogenase/fumarate reductase flavoprotein subunit